VRQVTAAWALPRSGLGIAAVASTRRHPPSVEPSAHGDLSGFQSLTSGGGTQGGINPLFYAPLTPAGVFHDVTSGNNDIYNDPDGEFAAGRMGSVHRAGLDRRREVACNATGTATSCTAGCGCPLREEGEGLGLRLSLVLLCAIFSPGSRSRLFGRM
jgi:hypothetical protein